MGGVAHALDVVRRRLHRNLLPQPHLDGVEAGALGLPEFIGGREVVGKNDGADALGETG